MIAEEDNLGRRCGRSLAVAVMGALLLCSALQAQPVNFNDPALLAETAPLPKRLPDGGELQLSREDYLAPKGRRIEGNGIEPDVAVARTLEDLRRGRDPDLDAALRLLRTGESPTPSVATLGP